MHDVELAVTDGTILRGRIYEPAAEGVPPAAARPGVVMTHGFSATIDMALDGFARAFSDAGIVVLAYDHRHFGASDGQPRQVVNPWRQARDEIDALTWFAARPEVDEQRLGVWGSSFSGGQAIVLGAVDARVRAVVANVPYVGFGGPDLDAVEQFAALRAALADDVAGPAVATEAPLGPFAVVTEPGLTGDDGGEEAAALLGQPESSEFFLEFGGRTGGRWRNEVWLRRTFDSVPPFEPSVAAPFLHAPLLMVVASEDRVAPVDLARATFDVAPEPKRLVTIEGHHFLPYVGDGLAVAAGAARDWFARWL